MLTFTESQLDALDEVCRQNFIEKLTLDLKKNEVGVASGLSHDELIKRVKATVNCAKSFGLSNRYSLTMFTKLSFIFGPRFYKNPVITRTLQSKNIEPHDRIGVIMKKMDGSWEDVEEINDWDFYCGEFIANDQ